jgi:hypothetical protein
VSILKINYKAIFALMSVALIMICLLAFVVSAGCVTAGKEIYADITATPIPTPTPTPEPTPTPIPTPTPTPEPTLSPEQYLEQYGGLKMGQRLSWMREDVDGRKDIRTHVTVYDWRTFGTVEWHSVSWNQYFREGAGDGMKFLFVFVNAYTDEGSARTWGIQPDQFAVEIKGEMYHRTEKLLPEIRLKEFDEIFNLDHVENIKPYGYIRTYNSEGKETVESQGFLKAGRSNAHDGYIVYIIPANTEIPDIKVHGVFGNLASNHWWQLE